MKLDMLRMALAGAETRDTASGVGYVLVETALGGRGPEKEERLSESELQAGLEGVGKSMG